MSRLPDHSSRWVSSALVATGAGLGLAVVAYAFLTPRASDAPVAASPRGAKLVALQQGSLERSLLVTGELVPTRAVRITVPRFRERGTVPIQAMAPEGSVVQPGDLLLQIDSANLMSSLQTEKINLEKAANDRIKKEAEEQVKLKDLEREAGRRKLELAKAELKAAIPQEYAGLWEWQNNQFVLEKARKESAAAERSLELARKAAEEEVALAQLKHAQIEARIRAIESDLDALRIVSDRSGTVLYEYAPLTWNSGDARRKFQMGDQVNSGMVIMSVPDLTEMEVRAYVSEVDGGRVRRGQRVRLAADSHPTKRFEGMVESVAEVADWSSAAERSDPFNGSIVLNSHQPGQMWAPADFDLRHQVNANWIVELPFGRGKIFGGNQGGVVNALIGGWQLAGIGRWTSGFPVSAIANVARSTGRYFRGFMTPVGETPATQNTRNAQSLGGGPNLFADPAAAFSVFGITPPGETGPRNNLRGDGLFQMDLGLSKSFEMPWSEQHRLALRWEVFNATNSVRFDTRSLSLTDQSPATFGRYGAALTPPRVMQFLLRYTF